MHTPESKAASVTLRDLATDLDYWLTQLNQVKTPRDLDRCMNGISALAEVIHGYAEAGFRLDP